MPLDEVQEHIIWTEHLLAIGENKRG